jgi:ABC-type transporter Mla subunit MlaD
VVIAGLVVTAAIGGFVFLAEQSYNGLPLISYRTLYATLPNIGHLQLHDPVVIAGARVGQVLSTSTRDGKALVELQLQGVKPFPVGTQVRIRDNGLLGARDVDIVPGTSKELLANGATITATANDYYPSLPDTLNLFDAKTRGALGQMIGGLGQGVLGRGVQLNDAIHVLPTSGANFDTVGYSILARPGAAARLLPATDAGVSALDAARNDIAGMFAPGARTLQAFIDDRTQFDRAIAEAPSTLSAVDLGFGAPAQRLLASLRSVAAAADQVLPAAPMALSSASQLLTQAPGPLQNTKVVLRQLRSAVPATLKILTSLQPDLTPLKKAFTWLVGPVTSLGQHGCDIKSFGETWRSILLHGVLPPGPSGPRDGFRAVFGAFGPGALGAVAPVGPISYPENHVYKPACKYFPGSVYNLASISTLLGTR